MLIREETDKPADAPELLTTSEVADIYRVARSTVLSWAAQGKIPYFTTPTGRLRFARTVVEADLAARSREAAT
jgi:excisionase family DNA binding protein